VGDHVGIAVPLESGCVGEVAAAEHEPSLGIAAEAVHVEALTDAEFGDDDIGHERLDSS
jgi:hypothetical protein